MANPVSNLNGRAMMISMLYTSTAHSLPAVRTCMLHVLSHDALFLQLSDGDRYRSDMYVEQIDDFISNHP